MRSSVLVQQKQTGALKHTFATLACTFLKGETFEKREGAIAQFAGRELRAT